MQVCKGNCVESARYVDGAPHLQRLRDGTRPALSRCMSGILSERLENSVDATRGQPLAMRILARKNELEDALAELGPHDTVERQGIETALATVYLLMTGDL